MTDRFGRCQRCPSIDHGQSTRLQYVVRGAKSSGYLSCTGALLDAANVDELAELHRADYVVFYHVKNPISVSILTLTLTTQLDFERLKRGPELCLHHDDLIVTLMMMTSFA